MNAPRTVMYMSKRNSIEKIRLCALSKKIILLSEAYINRNANLSFKCLKHGEFSVNFSNFKRSKYGCPQCAYEIGSQKQALTLEQAKDRVIKAGYVPNFNEYNRAKNKVSIICDKHGAFNISIDNLDHGKRCKKCSLEYTSKKNALPIDEVRERIIKKGFIPLFDEYNHHDDELLVNCKKHGNFYTKIEAICKNQYGCPKCSRGKSKAQRELYEFIKKYYPNVQNNMRGIIKPFEIDVYIPEISLGIEYCGLVWHSEQFKKNKKYHFNKMKLANDKGIRLITIFEDEWLKRKDCIKSFLVSVLNGNNTIIGARKTKIRSIPKNIANNFLNQYHIQGATTFEIAFGLFHEEKLLGLISGNRHHRQGFKNVLVLNRLVFKSDISIPGGASKLLKELIKYAKENNYDKIISWSDNRWSEGNVYKKMGFIMEKELPVDYSYVKKENRYSKQSNQKKHLLKKGAIGKTESEMALSLGLYRIWDCGKKRWSIDIR